MIIDGVKIIKLKKNTNEKGFLMEVQRNNSDEYLGFGDAYITSTKSKIVKAWYKHTHQTDQIAVINGTFKLVLFDVRKQSISKNIIQEIVLDEMQPILVQIPPGIWHGFQNIGNIDAVLLHMNTVPFDAENMDEEKLSIQNAIIPYIW